MLLYKSGEGSVDKLKMDRKLNGLTAIRVVVTFPILNWCSCNAHTWRRFLKIVCRGDPGRVVRLEKWKQRQRGRNGKDEGFWRKNAVESKMT